MPRQAIRAAGMPRQAMRAPAWVVIASPPGYRSTQAAVQRLLYILRKKQNRSCRFCFCYAPHLCRAAFAMPPLRSCVLMKAFRKRIPGNGGFPKAALQGIPHNQRRTAAVIEHAQWPASHHRLAHALPAGASRPHAFARRGIPAARTGRRPMPAYSKKSFRFSKNFLIFGVSWVSMVPSSWRSSSFCSRVSLVGVSTTTVKR